MQKQKENTRNIEKHSFLHNVISCYYNYYKIKPINLTIFREFFLMLLLQQKHDKANRLLRYAISLF